MYDHTLIEKKNHKNFKKNCQTNCSHFHNLKIKVTDAYAKLITSSN